MVLIPHNRKAKGMKGSDKIPYPSELPVRRVARKSVVALKDIHAGDLLTKENIGCKRPGTGVAPMYLPLFWAATATKDVVADALVDFSLVDDVTLCRVVDEWCWAHWCGWTAASTTEAKGRKARS